MGNGPLTLKWYSEKMFFVFYLQIFFKFEIVKQLCLNYFVSSNPIFRNLFQRYTVEDTEGKWKKEERAQDYY